MFCTHIFSGASLSGMVSFLRQKVQQPREGPPQLRQNRVLVMVVREGSGVTHTHKKDF